MEMLLDQKEKTKMAKEKKIKNGQIIEIIQSYLNLT
jgi:hypothetical protein